MHYIRSSKFHIESLISSETVTSPLGDDGIPRNPTAITAITVNCNTTSVQLTGNSMKITLENVCKFCFLDYIRHPLNPIR